MPWADQQWVDLSFRLPGFAAIGPSSRGVPCAEMERPAAANIVTRLQLTLADRRTFLRTSTVVDALWVWSNRVQESADARSYSNPGQTPSVSHRPTEIAPKGRPIPPPIRSKKISLSVGVTESAIQSTLVLLVRLPLTRCSHR